MIGQTIKCENEGCEIEFIKRTHNQRYHDDECCRLATNAKIMKQYYKDKALRLGHKRWCPQCGNQLSRYNPDEICGPCSLKEEAERNSSISSVLSSVVIAS